VFQVCAIPFYAVLTRFVDLRWLMMFGLACFGISMWNFTPITHDWGAQQLLLPQAFRGFCQQFAVAPIVSLTLGGIRPERLKFASGLFNLMRNLGGAIGIATCGTILNDRTNLHFLRLAEHLNSTNTAMGQWIGQVGATSGHVVALKRLWALTMREAQTQTFADAFFVITLCFVVATAMVPLMRKVALVAKPADAH
jgi:DHA2 family multidrug resistance protein